MSVLPLSDVAKGVWQHLKLKCGVNLIALTVHFVRYKFKLCYILCLLMDCVIFNCNNGN